MISKSTFPAAAIYGHCLSSRKAGFWFCIWISFASISTGSAADWIIELLPLWAGKPLEFDKLLPTPTHDQQVSVTRLDMLLSRFALRTVDGTWVERTNWFAYVNGREGRTSLRVDQMPLGSFDRLRFSVGLPPIDNHANPSAFAADHPLNPNVNGLHWSWQGGYVFLALEGNWSPALPASRLAGYSWHLATDRMLTAIELPLDPDSSSKLQLPLNVDRLFPLSEETSSTHSRPDDAFAKTLRASLEQAFGTPVSDPAQTAQTDKSNSSDTKAGSKTAVPLIASNATPYALVLSRHYPQPSLPLDNPLTVEGVELGRQLFNDPRLSINNRQSCASCHIAGHAFTDGRKTSPGAENQNGTRNAMSLMNLAWKKAFFWDGRAASLREQVLLPIQNPIEMHESLTNVVSKLTRSNSNLPTLFARAFGTPVINTDRIARALEQFLLVQVSHTSKFDRGPNAQAELNEEEQRGFELFHTEYDPRRRQFGADCFHCHGGPLFESQAFANNGLDSTFKDPGRSLATGKPGDRGKFAVPSLRNVALTAPYMHDGRFTNLEEVIDHYASGVKRSPTLDPNLAKHPDGGVPLSLEDKRALVAFLRTLTDEQFSQSRDTLARSP